MPVLEASTFRTNKNKGTRIMNEKPRHKIWEWEITKKEHPMSMNPTGNATYWYCLKGLSNHYTEGRSIRTSKIIRLDFESGIVETHNSIYELQYGKFEQENK